MFDYITKKIRLRFNSKNKKLINAIINGKLINVKSLIKSGANVNYVTEDSLNALMCAIKSDNLAIVKYLINSDINIDYANILGNTALIWAAKAGHIDVVNTLLLHNVNIHHRNQDGHTALMLAAQSGHLDVVNILLENITDALSIDEQILEQDEQPLPTYEEVIKFIEENNSPNYFKDERNTTNL